MKKKIIVFCLLVFVLVPSVKTHAAGAASAAVTAAIHALQWSDSIATILSWRQQVLDMRDNITNTYESMRRIVDTERRALENLRSIGDIRSIDDFWSWQNRVFFLARESEQHFNNIQFTVGNRSYGIREVDQIPDALRDNFSDPFARNFTDEERRRFLTQHGRLTAGNYVFMRSWQQRNQEIAQRIMSVDQVLADEFDDAADRNQEMMDRYANVNEDLQEREILMNTHITAMQMEMAIREQTRLMVELHQYQLSRDRMMDTPPTPPFLSDSWNHNPFGSVTQGAGESSFSNW
jgi:hypothetical protein